MSAIQARHGKPPISTSYGLLCCLAGASVTLVVSAFAGRVQAAVPEWPTAPYRYMVVDQDLRTVLEEFGRNTGVRIVLADEVKGRVRGSLPQAAPQDFLDHVTKSYGLDWYYDGAVLHVSTNKEAETRYLDLHALPFARLAAGLAQAGLTDPRFVLREGPAPGMVQGIVSTGLSLMNSIVGDVIDSISEPFGDPDQ